jgi:hypothetical protein
MFEILRAGSARMRLGREVVVYCDAPVDPGRPEDGAEALKALAERVRGRIAARVDAAAGAAAGEAVTA